jgi:hypothetical protein
MDPVITIRSDADRERVGRWGMKAPVGMRVVFKQARRSVDQNALMWSLLSEISRKVKWFDEKLTVDEWKDLFCAALKKSKAVPGIDGGVVFLGLHTSTMTKAEFSELIELIYAFAAQHGVKLNDL